MMYLFYALKNKFSFFLILFSPLISLNFISIQAAEENFLPFHKRTVVSIDHQDFTSPHFLQQKWSQQQKSDRENFHLLLKFLQKSSSGAKLVQLAKNKVKEDQLEDVLVKGETSLTDSSLVRHFSAKNPNEVLKYEFKTSIYINKDLTFLDAVLDLAHELTHFVYRSPFNPYAKNFLLTDFIKNTVEAEGGEVEAFLMECQVLEELQIKSEHSIHAEDKCRSNSLSKKTHVEFYKLGPFYQSFLQELKKAGISEKEAKEIFPLMTEQQPTFISSAYSMPYPLAAIYEFNQVIIKACQNDMNRLKYMKENTLALAENHPSYFSQQKILTKMEKNYFDRCDNRL